MRALEAATGERRGRALFDLGNALVQECQASDVPTLDRAVASYEACLREPVLAEELREDAQHNLQIAQELRQRAKATAKKQPGDRQKISPEDDQRQPHRSRNGRDPMEGDVGPRGQLQQGGSGQPAKDGDAQASQQRQPGTGNLPPIADSDDLHPLAPEDALAHLRQATQRIRNDQQKQKLQTTRPTRNVLDW